MKTATKQSKESRIRQHGLNLLAIFPRAVERDPFTLCKKLRRLEAKAAAVALRLCNGPEYPNEDDADKACAEILCKVNTLLGNWKGACMIVPLFINRDPRGYALKIRDDWMLTYRSLHSSCCLERDWGGCGLLAPEIK